MNEDAGTWVDDGTQGSRDFTVQVITWGLVVIAGVLSFVPGLNPAVLALLGIGPWLLLLLVFVGNGRYLLFGQKGHTVLAGVLILPMVLGFGAVLRFHMIDWQGPLSWAVGIGVGYGLLAKMADASAIDARPAVVRPQRKGSAIGLLLGGGLLGWATLVNLNVGAASLAPDAHLVTIARKWISGGRSHSLYVNFADAPSLGITDFEVSRSLYGRSAPGDRVCLVVHTGGFGWRWYEVRDRSACGDPFWGKQS
jgi:hypothetical protein